MGFDEQSTLDFSGSQKYLTGVELTKHRGEFLNQYLYEENNDAYKFLGTSNGVSAVNVVAGGKGTCRSLCRRLANKCNEK